MLRPPRTDASEREHPVNALREIAAVARLDLAEVLRSRWLLFCAGVYALLSGVFVLVGMRESSLMGFTGMGRVLLSFSHALLLLLPLLALTATGQVVNRAREDGTLELLFSLPVRRGTFFVAVSATRYLALVLPLAALMLGMGVLARVAFGQDVPWYYLGRAIAISAALLLAFVGVGTAIGAMVRSPARAMLAVLLAWALGVALLDFALVGLMLRLRLQPETVFLLAAVNPVEAARVALLSAAEPELSVLGPVGFWLVNRLGGPAMFAAGLVWPSLVGLLSWGAALGSFRRKDIV